MSDLQSAGDLGIAGIDLPPGFPQMTMAADAEALLQPSHEHQDDHNEQYNSQASAWAITPIAAVTPMGQSAEKKKDHEN
jgi:hypothetical protein